jgi:hypothetical protein
MFSWMFSDFCLKRATGHPQPPCRLAQGVSVVHLPGQRTIFQGDTPAYKFVGSRPGVCGRIFCRAAVGFGFFLLLLPVVAGCSRPASSDQPRLRSDTVLERARHDEALEYALQALRDLERYDLPETIRQMIDRLNQWIQDQKPLENWQVDPLVETLPEGLRNLLPELHLEQMKFAQEDASFFREVVWLRNIAHWAHQGAVDPLGQAEALFDWVVRNIQLESVPVVAPGSQAVRVLPWAWETLLFGRGTAMDRAWVFILLLRQLGIDAGIVGLVRTESLGGQRVDFWAVGVLQDQDLYLFEPTLGVPIPGPGSPQLDSKGALVVRPATLRQLISDPSLLRKLDLPDRRYPVRAEDLQQVVVFVDGSPTYLSQRMFLLQTRIAGTLSLVLTASPSEIANRFQKVEQVSEVRLLPLPYQVIENSRQLGPARTNWLLQHLQPFLLGTEFGSPLWKGRQYHFRGLFEGEETANLFYQAARAPERQLREQKLEPALANTLREVKYYASYWLGLVAYEQGNSVSAEDYLLERTLKAYGGIGPFTPGAVYNLARLYERDGQIAKALQFYRADLQSAGGWGNALRAHWLESLHPDLAKSPRSPRPEASTESQPQGEVTQPPQPISAGQGSTPAADSQAPAPVGETPAMPPATPGQQKPEEPAAQSPQPASSSDSAPAVSEAGSSG